MGGVEYGTCSKFVGCVEMKKARRRAAGSVLMRKTDCDRGYRTVSRMATHWGSGGILDDVRMWNQEVQGKVEA